MDKTVLDKPIASDIRKIPTDEDQFAQTRSLGISSITFKLTPKDSTGIFILENTFHAKGGPAKHLHYHQDEWFYVTAGNFVIFIDDIRHDMSPGDSILAPKQIPHVWAFVGDSPVGKMLITFAPAGKMVDFFQIVTKNNAMPPLDPELWRSHDMKLLGPPIY